MHLIFSTDLYLHLTSFILAGVAIVTAIYMISLAGKTWAWLLFSAALVLMTLRRYSFMAVWRSWSSNCLSAY
jgi:hypothetical protein